MLKMTSNSKWYQMVLPPLTIRGSKIWQGVVAPLLRHQVIDHVGVEVEGRRRQSLHHDVREVIREQHQVAARVVQKVGVVLALIFAYLPSSSLFITLITVEKLPILRHS